MWFFFLKIFLIFGKFKLVCCCIKYILICFVKVIFCFLELFFKFFIDKLKFLEIILIIVFGEVFNFFVFGFKIGVIFFIVIGKLEIEI